ncbi:MAG: SDR family oxidoreductase [Deltaproteobacteria bacterium]|nr:SDR family oxidoreductase [Deltaproteobacteria bacterium]
MTGGAGFIGSHIVGRLVEEGETVKVLDNLSTGKKENIDPYKDITFIQGDILDEEKVSEAVKGVDYICHIAALPSVARSVKDPVSTNDINIKGTLNILMAARDAGVKRVVFASSSSVYGDTDVLPKSESMLPQPLSPYATSKLTGEHYCRNFWVNYGLKTVSLRFFNVFGPRQDPNSEYAAVIPKFITTMVKGDKPIIFGDGTQSRDFTYVQNNVEANLLACVANGAAGKLFNVACGERITLNDLVDMLNRILGTDIEPIYAKPRQGDVKHSLADVSLAKDILRYDPKYTFENGLKNTVEWFLDSQN